MIPLDTNVLSEAMRVEPDERVMRWLDGHPPSVLFLSAVTVDEILFGMWKACRNAVDRVWAACWESVDQDSFNSPALNSRRTGPSRY